MSPDNRKLLYSGLIHSHLVYGLPIWGFAAKGRLEHLKTKQKKAIRKIYLQLKVERTYKPILHPERNTKGHRVNRTYNDVLYASKHVGSFSNTYKMPMGERKKARVDLRDKTPRIRHAIDSRGFIPDELKIQSKEYYLQIYYEQEERTFKTQDGK